MFVTVVETNMEVTMKKLILSLSATLLVVSSSAFSANFCAAGICYFGSLDKPNKHAEFHCSAHHNVTRVKFSNHNLTGPGFNSDGKLKLEGTHHVRRLKTFYFRVTPDHKHHSSSAKTVTYSANGKIECSMGKGHRKLPFYRLFTI